MEGWNESDRKNDLYVYDADNGARAIARTRKGAYRANVMCN